MPLDTKQYAEELFKAAGVSDDTVKQAVTNFLSNDAVAKRLGDDVLRQQDYSRKMDETAAEKKKAAAYYESLLTWKAEQERLIAEATGQQQQQQFQQVQPDLTTLEKSLEKKWEEKLAQRDGQMIGLLEVGMSLASRHAVEFKEPLDTAALKKIAIEKNVSLQQAYDEYVGPRRAAQSEAQFKAKLAEAKAEGAREFASTHKIPVDTQPRDYHPILDRDLKKMVAPDDYKPNTGELSPAANRALQNNFVEAWHTATAGGGTSGT